MPIDPRASAALPLAWLATAVALVPGAAAAFTVSSALTTACHEPITMEALRNVRLESSAAAPLVSVERDDRAVLDDLPFKVDPDMRDLGAVALLIGIRDNDLKGREADAIDSLAQIHGDPAGQREHCLRAPEDDEPGGSARALGNCRGFIHEMFLDALEGLGDDGRPAIDSRVEVGVGLSLRGKVKVSLPRFYFRIGQALHALQDSFTHTYRTADRGQVTVVLNYVDGVNGTSVAGRDGPAHSSQLDRCDAADSLRARNRALAVDASGDVLVLALDPNLDRTGKVAALDAVLDRYLGYAPGCTEANGWCDAPETEIASNTGCGCGAGGAGGLLIAGAALFLARRVRGTRLLAPLLVLALPAIGWAQAAPEALDSPQAAVEGTVVPISPSEVRAVQKEEAHQSLFSLSVAGAGSFYNAGVAAVVGARLRLSSNWMVGVDAELNGWYGIQSRRMRTGATSVYASIILRYPLRFEAINLRSSLQLGVAVQMFDLAGVPAGSVGVFAGLNPLGIEVKLSGHFFLIFCPLGVALPATQLNGAPFAYPQFRSTLGLEVSF